MINHSLRFLVLMMDEDGRVTLVIMTDGVSPEGERLEGTWSIYFDEAGEAPCTLPTDAWGNRARAPLRAAATVGLYTCKAGTVVEPRDDGSVESRVLDSDQQVADFRCKGNTVVRFHEDGSPASFTLVEDHLIGEVPVERKPARS